MGATRKNRRPIFLVAFARGGSNLLLNMLRSHPEVCSPRGETQEVFLGKPDESPAVRAGKALRYLPIWLSLRGHRLSDRDWRPRPAFGPAAQRRIDRILYDEKLRARGEGQNEFIRENVRYSDAEIEAARLLCKNLNGLIFASHEFHRIYPDATFLALIRDARAVVEGHLRRGHELETFALNYERAARQMIEDSQRIPRYRLLRYEDLVADPRKALEEVYRHCDLDLAQVPKIRLETKAVMDGEGKHVFVQGAKGKRMVWYDLEDFHHHIVGQANENQIQRLGSELRARIEEICGESLRHFGYLR